MVLVYSFEPREHYHQSHCPPQTHTCTHTHTCTYTTDFSNSIEKSSEKWHGELVSFFLCFIFIENIHMMIFGAFAFLYFQRQHYSKFLELFINLFWFCFRFCFAKETGYWSMSWDGNQVKTLVPPSRLASSVTTHWENSNLGIGVGLLTLIWRRGIWSWHTSVPERPIDFIIVEFKCETDWLCWPAQSTGVFISSWNNGTPIQSPRTPDGSPVFLHLASSPELQMELT